MKKFYKVVLAATMVFSMVLSVGCNTELDLGKPASVALIIGARENFEDPMSYLSSSIMKEQITPLLNSESNIALYNVSQSPQMIEAYEIKKSNAVTQQQVETDRRIALSTINEKATSVRANAPEADLLKAIILASEWLNNQPENHDKHIIIIDSGISTSGLINFAKNNNLISISPERLTDVLQEAEGIPLLEGVIVTFYGLGNSQLPQHDLSYKQKKQLQNLWCAIIEAGGGQCDVKLPSYSSESIITDYPVSPVDFPEAEPIYFDSPIELTDQQVSFKPNTSTFKNVTKAEATLKPIVMALNDNPDRKIMLIGMTATGRDIDYCTTLSLARASAVADLMIKMSASQEQLIVRGIGCLAGFFERFDDTDDLGNLIEEKAALNRRVIIIDAASDIALKIK